MKDVMALHSATLRLCRLSVWDQIGGVSLGDVLAGAELEPAELSQLVARRTI
jgi:hypothetical protein